MSKFYHADLMHQLHMSNEMSCPTQKFYTLWPQPEITVGLALQARNGKKKWFTHSVEGYFD